MISFKKRLLQTCLLAGLCAVALFQAPAAEPTSSLKSALGEKFLIGVAMNGRQIGGSDTNATALIKEHFNSIVAENCMKCMFIHPEENRFNFKESDQFVRFGQENNMAVIGHCLIWHSQLAPWFCVDEKGDKVSPDVLKARMKTHISTVMGRYRGKIKGWDVVNEAIEGDGSWRKSPFYEILGEEYIPLAFQYAQEADPDAELYYNDYGMDGKAKRAQVVKLVKNLKARNIRIDAVGMQGHISMEYPSLKNFEESILAFSAAGVKVMITEMDLSALPSVHRSSNISDTVEDTQKKLNPYPDGLPDPVSEAWNNRMESFFTLFQKHSDVVSRVTVWGLTDANSWRNGFPIRGRKDYPLLFDRQYEPKPFVKKLITSQAPKSNNP